MKKNQFNHVFNLTGQLKKNLKQQELKEQRIKELDTILKMALEQFKENLQKGRVQLRSVSDLEKLVKLKLLIEGEPTDILETKENVSISNDLTIDEFREEMGEDFEKLTEMIYKTMNERNDKAGKE